MNAITVRDLTVWRQSRTDAPRTVIHDLSFAVGAGERVVVAGPNGAGKSSLLWALVGALPSRGEIEVFGRPLSQRTLETIRIDIGLVFEDPRDQLFLDSVAGEVAFGPRQRGLTGAALEQRVRDAVASVALTGFESRHPLGLSLGEQRRLATACILACDPRIVLLDEPTANLDPIARRMMLEVIANTNRTVIIATHDLDAALGLGARILLLRDGALVDQGPAEAILLDQRRLQAAGLDLPLSVAALRTGR
jgi:energy-coupling factor transporter ATP-binding protein EcfA2